MRSQSAEWPSDISEALVALRGTALRPPASDMAVEDASESVGGLDDELTTWFCRFDGQEPRAAWFPFGATARALSLDEALTHRRRLSDDSAGDRLGPRDNWLPLLQWEAGHLLLLHSASDAGEATVALWLSGPNGLASSWPRRRSFEGFLRDSLTWWQEEAPPSDAEQTMVRLEELESASVSLRLPPLERPPFHVVTAIAALEELGFSPHLSALFNWFGWRAGERGPGITPPQEQWLTFSEGYQLAVTADYRAHHAWPLLAHIDGVRTCLTGQGRMVLLLPDGAVIPWVPGFTRWLGCLIEAADFEAAR